MSVSLRANPSERTRAIPRLGGAFLAAGLFLAIGATAGQAQAPAPQSRVTGRVDATRLVPLKGNTHRLATAQFDQGAASATLPMRRMLLMLKRSAEQEASLRELIDSQQDKSSPRFHQWLTPEEFGKQFGPSDQDLAAVTDWLRSEGFEVARISKGRSVLEFSGSADQVARAFHTEIRKYLVAGKNHIANATDPMIPEALAPVVSGLVSLNDFRRKPMHKRLGTFSFSREHQQMTPLFTGGNSAFFGVGPADFATIYNLGPLYTAATPIDGTGQSIAIIGNSNIVLQDVRDFRALFGLPAKDPVVVLDGPDPGLQGEEGEAILDVEWSGAVARNATINFVISESTQSDDGIDFATLFAIDNNISPIMSLSFGTCEQDLTTSGNQFFNALWQQAASQGITVVVSSGDNGSAGCDDFNAQTTATGGLAVNGIASTPFNVAVGGTDFDQTAATAPQFWNTTNDPVTRGSAKSYIPELTWNDSCAQNGLTSCATADNIVAGSGGPSTTYTKPPWQTGTGVPADGKRDLPDVSLFASDGQNNSFYVVCQEDFNPSNSSTPSCASSGNFRFVAVGGTSASAPAFAGIMALVVQKTNQRQGNPNYVLYKLAAQASASCNSSTPATITNTACTFYDVTKGNISVPCRGASPNCSKTTAGGTGVMVSPASATTEAWTTTAAYDLATGLGSVNATNLVNKWSSVTFTPSATTLTINPLTFTHGTSVAVTSTVTPAAPVPTGDVSLIGGPSGGSLGIDGFSLTAGTVSGMTNLLPGGNYTVHAHYAGDGTYGGSDSPAVTVHVTAETSKMTVGIVTFDPASGAVISNNATNFAFGSPYILSLSVTNAAGAACNPSPLGGPPCPAGTVTLTDNGQPLDGGTFKLNVAGFLEDQPIQLPAGAHNILASYAGDGSFLATTATTGPITVTKATTSNVVAVGATSILVGGTISLTATIDTPSNATTLPPGGSVQFLAGTTSLGTVSLTPGINSTTGGPQATATLNTQSLPGGQGVSITAVYAGDANYQGSTSAAKTVDVLLFQLSSPTPTATVAAGTAGTFTIASAPSQGFTAAVALTCSVHAPVPTTSTPTCSLNPASITPGGSPNSTVLTVASTSRAFFLPPVAPRGWPLRGIPALLAVALVLFCLWRFSAFGRHRLARAGAFVVLAALFVFEAAGCGGGGGGGGSTPPPPHGTPAGNYTVTVTGTSGTATSSVVVTLKVT